MAWKQASLPAIFLNPTHDWAWEPIPMISGQTPWLAFLYRGVFTFEDFVQHTDELEFFNCPRGCWQVCLAGITRVLIVYK